MLEMMVTYYDCEYDEQFDMNPDFIKFETDADYVIKDV